MYELYRDELVQHFECLPEDADRNTKSKKTNNDQELIQSDPISCPKNQKGNN